MNWCFFSCFLALCILPYSLSLRFSYSALFFKSRGDYKRVKINLSATASTDNGDELQGPTDNKDELQAQIHLAEAILARNEAQLDSFIDESHQWEEVRAKRGAKRQPSDGFSRDENHKHPYFHTPPPPLRNHRNNYLSLTPTLFAICFTPRRWMTSTRSSSKLYRP